ncbi:MAG: hypothetical protein L3K26_07920 [Candidatus Hydrogenedentes bacterium]|nr:hypothetical protein [Candidatus Hydrogenedentota bacterium]
MRKFIQWGLIAAVAVGSIGLLAHGLFTESTGRARDVSVAALREKLARLETARDAEGSEVIAETPARLPAVSEPALDTAELRARWLALFEALAEARETCELNPKIRSAFSVFVVDTEHDALSAYWNCLGDSLDELLALCEQNGDLYDLYQTAFQTDLPEAYRGFLWAMWEMEFYFLAQAAAQDYPAAMAAYSARLNLSHVRFQGYPRQHAHSRIIWPIIDDALASHTVDDETWNHLLAQLAAQRDPNNFVAEVADESERIITHYEDGLDANWYDPLPGTRFSESPVNYSRNWAYIHVSTALYNHDMDLFSRAMSALLDLTALPYYEAKPALERFYEEFDVEPSLEELRFIRGNSAWYYVLRLSRAEFVVEANRQASIDIVRFAILLDRHQRETGAYPESLEALAEGLGGSVPINPIDGTPYIYERNGGTFRLGYSHEQFLGLVEKYGFSPNTATFWNDPDGEHAAFHEAEARGANDAESSPVPQ